MEFPQYVLKPNPTRMLFPQFIKMFLLSLIFYVGLKLNLIILEVAAPIYVDILTILGLLVLSALQVILTKKHQTKIEYNFYANRIEKTGFKPKTILFADVKGIKLKRNVFDKIFNTGDVKIEPEFDISSVTNANQVYAYAQKLVQNFRYAAYSQYYQQPETAQGTSSQKTESQQTSQQTTETQQSQETQQ